MLPCPWPGYAEAMGLPGVSPGRSGKGAGKRGGGDPHALVAL